MEEIHINLTDNDRYFLSVLFSLAGNLAKGISGETAVVSAIAVANSLKERLQEYEPDEQ